MISECGSASVNNCVEVKKVFKKVSYRNLFFIIVLNIHVNNR